MRIVIDEPNAFIEAHRNRYLRNVRLRRMIGLNGSESERAIEQDRREFIRQLSWAAMLDYVENAKEFESFE